MDLTNRAIVAYPVVYFGKIVSICLCFCILQSIWMPLDVFPEPLSKSTMIEMLKMYNQDQLSKAQLESELGRWGIDFQLSKETIDEFGTVLNSEKKRSLTEFLKNQVAPLSFNGHGIEILSGKQLYLAEISSIDKDESPCGTLRAVYEDPVEPGFRQRSFEGDQLQLNFYLKNLSDVHKVCYKDVYLEILGGNRLNPYAAGDAEPDQRRVLTSLNLCAHASFFRKERLDLFNKKFLKADWFLVARDPKGPVCLPPNGREAYQVSMSYMCPLRPSPNDPCAPMRVLYGRFVVPYDFGDGATGFARSDKFYRIYLPFSENLIVTEYSEEQFLDLMLSREINGFVINNAFSRMQVERAKKKLESIVLEANRKKVLSRQAFQALVALQILGSERLTGLAEDYVRTSLEVYETASKRPVSDWRDSKGLSKWCPVPRPDGNCIYDYCNIAYIQVQSPTPDWDACGFRPYYLTATDPRLSQFRRVAEMQDGDFAANYAILLDILTKAKSPLIEEIRRKNYPISLFKAYFGADSQ